MPAKLCSFFPYMQLNTLVELATPCAPLRPKENIGRAQNRDETLVPLSLEHLRETVFRRKSARDAQSAL
jgi:hypothetical protein